MQYQVGAQCKWILINGGRKSIIDNYEGKDLVAIAKEKLAAIVETP